MQNRAALTTAIALLIASPAPAQPVADGPPDRPDVQPAFADQTEAPERISTFVADPVLIAAGLEHPWAVAVLPDGAGYLVTERPGRLRHIARDGTVSAPISGVPEVFAVSQGGLLDVALAPDFADSRVLYLSFSKPLGLMRSATAVIRATLSTDHAGLGDVTEIFEQTPPPACRSISEAAWYRTPTARSGSPPANAAARPDCASWRKTPPPPMAPLSGSRRMAPPPRATLSRPVRRRARTLHAGPAQHPGRGTRAGDRRAMDHRTRARRRGRVEPDRTGRQLRLADW
jgi:hypothetical protein